MQASGDEDDDERDALLNMIFNSQVSTQSVAYAPSSAHKSSKPKSSAQKSQHSPHHNYDEDDDDERDALRNMIFNSQVSTQSVAYAPSSAHKSSKSPSSMFSPNINASQISQQDDDRDYGEIDELRNMIFNSQVSTQVTNVMEEDDNDSDSSESYHADVSKLTRMTLDKFKKRKRPDMQIHRNSHKTIVRTMKQKKTHMHPIFHNSYDLRCHSFNKSS